MKHPQFYRALDQMILFPWLFSEGFSYITLTFWMYLLVFLVFLFTVNTAVCTIDKVYAILKNKRPWQSFFPHIVHIGFLIALLGHLAGSVGGFRSSGNLVFKGDSIPVPDESGLFLRLNDLEMKEGANGDLEHLRSNVTLLSADKSEILTGDIEINGPLIYKGVAFYHFDQGTSPSGIILRSGAEEMSVEFKNSFKTSDGAAFKLGNIYPDFALDADGRPMTRSANFRNPHIEVTAENGAAAFLDLSRSGTEVTVNGKTFRLIDYIISPYVVFSIHKDPGIWFIIAGSAVLVAGMVLLLFFRGERGELLRQRGLGN